MEFAILQFVIWLLPFAIVGLSEKKTLDNLLFYFLIINVGIQGVLVGLIQMFAGKVFASYLGWSWSPFTTELGIANLAFGVLGILSYWKRSFDFWMASALGYSVFLLLSFFNHIHHKIITTHTVKHGHMSPLIYAALLTPITLCILFWIHGKKKNSWFE